MSSYTELELDALRELANIGSGTAATALSQMLGRPIDVSVPTVAALPLQDAVEQFGPAETVVTAVVLPTFGDLEAIVVLLFEPDAAATLCSLLGVEPGTELGAAGRGVDVVRERRDRAAVQVEPAARIAAGGEEEQRAAGRRRPLVAQLDVDSGRVRDHGQRVDQLELLQVLQPVAHGPILSAAGAELRSAHEL